MIGPLSITKAPSTDAPNAREALRSAGALPLPQAARAGAAPAWLRGSAAKWAAGVSASLLLVLAPGFIWAWHATPSVDGLDSIVRQRVAQHHTAYTPLSAVARVMQRALVASEDQRFYMHHGIDLLGLGRATLDDLRAGQFVEGGSTLTAQLAKNAYLNGHDHTIPLKLEDLMLALKVEHSYNKDAILAMYLNLTYYGEGAYGIGAAAVRYFGVSPAHLDLAQAAMLASLVQAPGAYDPWCHPQQAHMRQEAVLDRMVAAGYITPTQASAAAAERSVFAGPGGAIPHDAYCPA